VWVKQFFRLGFLPQGIRIQGFDDQNWKKISAERIFFLIKNYNLSIPWPPLRTSKLQKKPSALKRGHPTLQNMNLKFFKILLWVIFALVDPDREFGSVYGFRDPIESGSNLDPDTDPDLQYWLQYWSGFQTKTC